MPSAVPRDSFGCFWALAEGGDDVPHAGPLGGLTVGVKDAFDVAGLPATGGIAGFGHVAEEDAAPALGLEEILA